MWWSCFMCVIWFMYVIEVPTGCRPPYWWLVRGMWSASCSLLYTDDWGSMECTVAWMGGNDKNIPVRSSTPPITTTTATIPTFLQGRITLNICVMYVYPNCSLSYRTASIKPWTSALNKWGSLTAVTEQARPAHLVDCRPKALMEKHSFVLQIMKYLFFFLMVLL